MLLTCWRGWRGLTTMGAERGMKEERERNGEMCCVCACSYFTMKEGEGHGGREWEEEAEEEEEEQYMRGIL